MFYTVNSIAAIMNFRGAYLIFCVKEFFGLQQIIVQTSERTEKECYSVSEASQQ